MERGEHIFRTAVVVVGVTSVVKWVLRCCPNLPSLTLPTSVWEVRLGQLRRNQLPTLVTPSCTTAVRMSVR